MNIPAMKVVVGEDPIPVTILEFGSRHGESVAIVKEGNKLKEIFFSDLELSDTIRYAPTQQWILENTAIIGQMHWLACVGCLHACEKGCDIPYRKWAEKLHIDRDSGISGCGCREMEQP